MEKTIQAVRAAETAPRTITVNLKICSSRSIVERLHVYMTNKLCRRPRKNRVNNLRAATWMEGLTSPSMAQYGRYAVREIFDR